jgi:hypothetical protein
MERKEEREEKEGSMSLFCHEEDAVLDIFGLFKDEDVIEGLLEQKVRLFED